MISTVRRTSLLMLTTCLSLSALAASAASPGPSPMPQPPAIAAPADIPFPGTISLAVDASDTDHRIVKIKEVIPVPAAGEMVLLYPQWLPGTHAPEGTIDRLAGLVIKAGDTRLSWSRDSVNMFAFHVTVPEGVKNIEATFQYLSPVSGDIGNIEFTSSLALLEWNSLLLYPAGYFTRQIPVSASITLPQDWSFATALTSEAQGNGSTRFATLPLETLIDSPIYAGRYMARFDLDPGGPAPVHLNVFSDKQSELAAKPEQLAPHRALVQQAYKLFGSHHYDHYDFLFTINDLMPWQGLEHHRSSEDGVGLGYFADYDKSASVRSLMPHEFTHSWNGKFRRPADLWTANYNVPMRDSLLWVYEGQTQYWGEVLTARSGLVSADQERDSLAQIIAAYDQLPGRAWRALQDTTNDEIINPRRPLSWRSWQRFEDYYDEGALIWFDADTLIRELSKGKKSLDDFARSFFGIEDGSYTPVTYSFDDVVTALNKVQPYDWASFLRNKLDAVDQAAPLDGLKRSGYRLVYTDIPGDYIKSIEGTRKVKLLDHSVGVVVGKDGMLSDVIWNGPAFKAGLTSGMTLVAVNGLPYSDDNFAEQITAAKGTQTPIELIVKTADRYKVVSIDYHDGLRYPHLERDPAIPDLLSAILAPRR